MKPTQIKTLRQLKKAAKNGLDCFILLNFGLKSSKHIWYDESSKQFEIINFIDGSEVCLKEKELFSNSNIGKALEKGALYAE